MSATCTQGGCEREARMAVRTLRPTRPELKSVIWYDDRTAPRTAQRYCRKHGYEVVVAMMNTLVSEDE